MFNQKSREEQQNIGVVDNTAPVITREPVVKQILEQPQVAKIVEVKNVEIRSKQIVQEIREQPIIELEKKHITEHVKQDDIVKHQRAKTQYEEVTLGDQQPQLDFKQDTQTQTFKENSVKHINLEPVKQVVHREIIERHVIPMVTEERHQKIINVIEQPIVRTIYKQPIIREVGATTQQPIQQAQPMQEASFVPKVDELQQGMESLQETKPLASSAFKEELQSFELEHKEQHASFVPEVRDLNRAKLNLHEARPFRSHSFQQEIGNALHKRTYSEHDRASFVPEISDLKDAKQHLHSAKPFASEEFKQQLQGAELEQHSRANFVPDEQELLAQKLELTQAKPLSSHKFKQEIESHKAELTDSSAWREGSESLPSTHVLREKQLISAELKEGVFSSEEFKDELARGKTVLHDAKPLASEDFKQELVDTKDKLEHNTFPFAAEEFREQIQYGQEVLHDTHPFSHEGFAEELQAQKLRLEKSRYFSKPVFLPEFMAQKLLLKPSTENVYSREINMKGEGWKRDWEHSMLEKAKDVVEDTVGAISETFHNMKEAIFGESK
jgi:hypothetical protein